MSRVHDESDTRAFQRQPAGPHRVEQVASDAPTLDWERRPLPLPEDDALGAASSSVGAGSALASLASLGLPEPYPEAPPRLSPVPRLSPLPRHPSSPRGPMAAPLPGTPPPPPRLSPVPRAVTPPPRQSPPPYPGTPPPARPSPPPPAAAHHGAPAHASAQHGAPAHGSAQHGAPAHASAQHASAPHVTTPPPNPAGGQVYSAAASAVSVAPGVSIGAGGGSVSPPPSRGSGSSSGGASPRTRWSAVSNALNSLKSQYANASYGRTMSRNSGGSTGGASELGGRSLGRGLSRVDPQTLFRSEALKELARTRTGGDLLRLTREWLGLTYWLLPVALTSALLFMRTVKIDDWGKGPALVRLSGRTDVTATAPGTVKEIEVRAGQHVQEGQLLVRFSGTQEEHEVKSTSSQFQAQLVRVLREPGDEATRKELARLRTQMELAESRLADRAVRAPRAGIVTDIRIRKNQLLQAGEIVLTLADGDSRPQVVALLPGYARSQLKPGMMLRFEPTSFEFAYQNLTIDSVGDEVLGPSEVRRYLGPELADGVPLTGPSLVVTAALPSRDFVSDGRHFLYSHGLPGQASARLRARTVMSAAIAKLRQFMKPKKQQADSEDGDKKDGETP